MSALPAISSECERKPRLATMAAVAAIASLRPVTRRRIPGRAAAQAQSNNGEVAAAAIHGSFPAASVAKA